MTPSVRDTSAKTYSEIKEEGFKDTWSEVAFEAVKDHPFMTAREYFDLIIREGTREQIFPRLTELKKKGYIIEVGKRKCTVSKRTCYVLGTLQALEQSILTKLGFHTTQKDLFAYDIEGGCLYQDFRQGKRRSYFLTKTGDHLDYTIVPIYKQFKEELNKIISSPTS